MAKKEEEIKTTQKGLSLSDEIFLGCALLAMLCAPIALIRTQYFAGKYKEVINRIPDNDQRLATECYVASATGERGLGFDGYIYEDKIKYQADKLEESNTEVKVKFLKERTEHYPGSYPYEEVWKWIPKKDFHKYYTLEEISEILNKNRSIKK